MRLIRILAAAFALAALAPATSAAQAVPDPLARGPYTIAKTDQYKVGLVNLQEPNAAGGNPSGANAAATLQMRGSLYMPGNRPTAAPLIVLVHGNHASCDTGSAPYCTVFKRNDRGYAYLGENLASWGYAVISIDQDQLIYYQDSQFGKGMHQRRLLIAGTLDAFYKANTTGLGATDADNNIGDSLIGKLDMSKIGMMGHSRGGDATTSFLDYNRTRPAPGRRYNIAGDISLAPVDYERRAPYGTPYMTILPYCDGDVSNLQGARFFERSQYLVADDPFPRIQTSVLGTNHNYFNSVWSADNDDASGQLTDPACGMNSPTTIRLTGGTTLQTFGTGANAYQAYAYTFANRGDGDPALMGDQNKIGLAVMASFFRYYVGGETGFAPYMTGELSAVGDSKQIPASACPSQANGTRIACDEYVTNSYFAGTGERLDVIRPEPDTPLNVSAVGTSLNATGFSNPYPAGGAVSPVPATTAGGIDWCNPEPLHFSPNLVGVPGVTEAEKPCPLPPDAGPGGRNTNRENAPVNHSYGLQLAVAWDGPATLSTRIPSGKGNVSGLRSLTMGADVNYFDARNPARTGDATWNPALTTQDFKVALTDAAGTTAVVSAGASRYGHALQQTTGANNARLHIVLDQIRIPLGDFSAQGLDLTKVRKLELRFGGAGTPATGSIQLSDVRFQESVQATREASTAAYLAATDRKDPSAGNPGPLGLDGATSTGCADAVAPELSRTSALMRAGRLVVKGAARDVGCGRGLASVQVSLARKTLSGCQFVRPNGRLSTSVRCSSVLAIVAKGKRAWRVRVGRHLRPARYRMQVRAYDRYGNVSRALTRTVRVR